MHYFKGVGLLALMLAVAGCTSVSEVTPVGKDTYSVGSQVRGGMESWAEVKALAVAQANSYCEAQGRKIVVIDTKTHGARGWTPQEAEVTFKCLKATDPEYR
ncbi:MAG: hypothetical protein ACOH12_07245 [Parvibaculaceae bacterium]